MAVTRSWEAKVIAVKAGGAPGRAGWREFAWLASASLLVGAGLFLVYSAKSYSFADAGASLGRGDLLDLNQVNDADQLLPFLQVFRGADERDYVAKTVFDFLTAHRPLANVGALGRLRVGEKEIEKHPEWTMLRGQLAEQLARQAGKPRRGELRVPLLPLAKLKPAFVVRTPREYQVQFLIWIAAYFAGFYAVFPGVAMERLSRRFCDAARDAFADRHRIDPGGELARSAARHAGVQQIRLGRGAGMRGAADRRRCAS